MYKNININNIASIFTDFQVEMRWNISLKCKLIMEQSKGKKPEKDISALVSPFWIAASVLQRKFFIYKTQEIKLVLFIS